MPFLILSIAIQVALIVHVVRTGRNTLWIFAIALLPVAGSIAYVLIEVLPGIAQSRAARRAARAVRRTLDPDRDLRQYSSEVRLSGNVDSHRKLAEELLATGQPAQAIETYRAALTGLYEHDPVLMLGLACAQFANGDFRGSREALDALIRHNPDFRSPDGHLLYARALEGEGNLDKAVEEYRALAKYFAGAEAKVRLAQLLKRRGDAQGAHTLFKEVLDTAELAPRHYRKLQREWLDNARREL